MCDNATIQSVLRWASEESVAIYAKWNIDEYWGLLKKAEAQEARIQIVNLRTSGIPRMGPRF